MGLTQGQCPLCKVPAPVLFTTKDVNRGMSRERFDYHRCPICDLVFIGRIPPDLFRYYQSGYHPFPRSQAGLERIAERLRHQIEMVRRFVVGGRLLDVGPGIGAFAWLAKSAGFQVEAIEQDAKCCEYLREQVGIEAIRTQSPIEVLSRATGRYDAVVLSHVLEHLTDPWDVLQHAARALAPGGILLVATPNPVAWQFTVLGPRWPHLDAPRHLYLVPFGILQRRLENQGLQCLLMTTNDPGALHLNQTGWGRVVVNALLPPRARGALAGRALAAIVGRCVSAVTAGFEQGEMRGSAYTAIFRRPV